MDVSLAMHMRTPGLQRLRHVPVATLLERSVPKVLVYLLLLLATLFPAAWHDLDFCEFCAGQAAVSRALQARGFIGIRFEIDWSRSMDWLSRSLSRLCLHCMGLRIA